MANLKNNLIEGKVAGILNERELTINVGLKDGVWEGMKFSILAKEPIEIYDPETKEKLGVVDREKVGVIAAQVEERFTICKTYKKWETVGSTLASMASVMMTPRVRHETLKVNDSSFPPPLSEEESYVKIGDRVIQMKEDDSE